MLSTDDYNQTISGQKVDNLNKNTLIHKDFDPTKPFALIRFSVKKEKDDWQKNLLAKYGSQTIYANGVSAFRVHDIVILINFLVSKLNIRKINIEITDLSRFTRCQEDGAKIYTLLARNRANLTLKVGDEEYDYHNHATFYNFLDIEFKKAQESSEERSRLAIARNSQVKKRDEMVNYVKVFLKFMKKGGKPGYIGTFISSAKKQTLCVFATLNTKTNVKI